MTCRELACDTVHKTLGVTQFFQICKSPGVVEKVAKVCRPPYPEQRTDSRTETDSRRDRHTYIHARKMSDEERECKM